MTVSAGNVTPLPRRLALSGFVVTAAVSTSGISGRLSCFTPNRCLSCSHRQQHRLKSRLPRGARHSRFSPNWCQPRSHCLQRRPQQ